MSTIRIAEEYISALALVHVIAHTRNTLNPEVVVIDQATGAYIIPMEVEPITTSSVQITLAVPRAIRGSIRGN